VREHDEANKILDMSDRKEQESYFRALPERIKPAVGDMVKIVNKARLNYCVFSWRLEHERSRSERQESK
jgi:hypothetical protein